MAGLASHAAVVARGWGLPAVVGARDVEVGDGTVRFPGLTLAAGDVITIDGDTGEVFRGAVAGASEIAPEARTLLDWARELGVAIPGPDDGTAAAGADTGAAAGASAGAATADDCVQALAVIGMAAAEGVARVLTAPVADVQPLLDGLVADGRAAAPGGTYRLTDAGRARRAELLAAEQAAIGMDGAVAALDGLLTFDGRLKAVVTDLQLRQTDAGPVLNDHADAAYDAAVIGRLAALHEEAAAWLAALEPGWPRAGRYRAPPRRGPASMSWGATCASWPRRASTATTASGSSCTRTSSCWPAGREPTRSRRGAPDGFTGTGAARYLRTFQTHTGGTLAMNREGIAGVARCRRDFARTPRQAVAVAVEPALVRCPSTFRGRASETNDSARA